MGRSKLNTQIYEEASEWFVECRAGGLNEAKRGELDRWLRKSPEHLSAYLEIAAIWDEARALDPMDKDERESLIAEAARDQSTVVAFSGGSWGGNASVARVEQQTHRMEPQTSPVEQQACRMDHQMSISTAPTTSVGVAGTDSSPKRPRARSTRRRLGLMAATLAGLALIVGGVDWVEQIRAPTFATALGEQRSFKLADGSTVSLNSRSRIRVRYSAHERNVELMAGQALFQVSKDPSRPFVVMSGTTRVRAVGTEFDVYQKRDDTVVTVVEGRVAVLTDHPAMSVTDRVASMGTGPATRTDERAPKSPSSSESASGHGSNILLSEGEQLTVTPSELKKSDHANVAGATAWTMRRLVFESASLTEVAEEFNRYNERQLVIADPDLDSFHISGVFSSTDPASLIRFLRSRPGLRVIETDAEILIEKK